MQDPKLRELWPLIPTALLLAAGVVPGALGLAPGPLLSVALYTAAFVGAALLLAWGTELAQLDLPPGLAVLVLALLAILPEYSIDLLFAYRAGHDPSQAPLALANMTGANRLLIGFGWSLVVAMGALGARREKAQPKADRYALALSRRSAVDVFMLGCVSLYTLSFAFRSSLTLVDCVVLFVAFGVYLARLWTAPKEEPRLIGPPAFWSNKTPAARRAATLSMLTTAAAVIVMCARPLADALVASGEQLGIERFVMVQWIAPLSTESAELVAAAIFAYRQMPDQGLGTLLSSKVNQWTLLVGGVPIAFAISHGGLAGLPIDATQRQELLLTAAQSVFAVSLLIDDLRLGARGAALIALIFAADLLASVALPPAWRSWTRYGFSGLYLALSAWTVLRARRHLRELSVNALLRPVRDLDPQPHPAVSARGHASTSR